jgi:galactoside O-acetyltransferase
MKRNFSLEEAKKRMHSRQVYQCNNKELIEEQVMRLDLLFEYNHTKPSEQEKKNELLHKMFASFGEGSYVETPFHANWAGKYVHIGKNFYSNFNLTMVDDCDITIGDDVLIAPNVTLCAGTHPVNPEIRKYKAQYNLPISIGNNVWIGSNSVVLPGVTIGDDSINGAGSVVTKDIPSGVVAVGNPCKVMREISEKDFQVGWETIL